MRVVYIQDQEIGYYKGEYYHSKSEHFFERYLTGLSKEDTLTVYCGITPLSDENIIRRYQNVSHPQISYKEIPEFRKLRNISKIYRIVKEALKEADFCYLRCGIASSFAGYVCRNKGIPYMAVLNEDVFKNLWNHPNKVFKLFAYPLSWMTKSLVRNADYACYVTQEYLQRRYPCRGELCGCSDVEYLDLDETAVIKRIEKIESKKDIVVLGSLGSVSAKLKGQDTVIKALAKLKERGINNYSYELVGAGSPERLIYLAKALGVSDRVFFKGEYSHNDVLSWFDGIDIYVHPSHSEGLPRTILEAMTKAVPCICTKVGGVPELINEDCLFEYNGNEVSDLSQLIVGMTVEKMRTEAVKNFEKSKDYNPKVLELKRRAFFEKAINATRKSIK